MHPSMRPIVDPELLRSTPSSSTRPIVEPELLRIVPLASTRPMVEPDALRTVPSLVIRPIVEPDPFRIVPSSSMRPIEEPDPFRTVIADHANAGTDADARTKATTSLFTKGIYDRPAEVLPDATAAHRVVQRTTVALNHRQNPA